MAEIRETHVVKERAGSSATPWLAFIVGALLIAVVAVLDAAVAVAGCVSTAVSTAAAPAAASRFICAPLQCGEW